MAEDVKLARVEALVDDDVRFVVDVVWRFRVVLLVIDFCLKWKKEKHFFSVIQRRKLNFSWPNNLFQICSTQSSGEWVVDFVK